MRGRVLIIDDELLLCRSLKRVLSVDHLVEIANTGIQARAMLCSDRDFDVIVCDLHLRDDDGMSIYRWLLSVNPELATRMIFMTGERGTIADLDQLRNQRLSKPMPMRDLRGAINQLLAS